MTLLSNEMFILKDKLQTLTSSFRKERSDSTVGRSSASIYQLVWYVEIYVLVASCLSWDCASNCKSTEIS
jgi:hypothetical protein